MLPNFKREYTQIISLTLMVVGLLGISLSHLVSGASLIGVACWVILISESMLLSKVQNEMSVALEALRKKQEIEVKDLLFYLRQSELGNSPWSNIEAAKNYINKISFPAIITDSGGVCIALNKHLTEALGYGKDFIGELCHTCQKPDTYGEYVQGIQANLEAGKRFMHSRLIFIDSSGDEHEGTISIIFLPDMRTAVGIWLPDNSGILKSTNKSIKKEKYDSAIKSFVE